MERSKPISRHVFAEDRTYKREVVQFEGLDTVLKLGSIVPKIKRKSELELFLQSVIVGENTDGVSIPIYVAGDILGERLLGSRQVALSGGSADVPFAQLVEGSILIDADVDALSHSATTENYTKFLRRLDNRLLFPQKVLASFDKDEKGNLVKNKDAYNTVWEVSVDDAKERIRLCEAYILYPFRVGGRLPSIFTRTMESNIPESLTQAALLNKESNSICKNNGMPKTLALSIGATALSSRSFINELIHQIMDRNAFGNKFDLLHLSMPNQDIHNSSGQRKNFMLLYQMIQRLKFEYGIKAIVNDVDIALAEACMGLGFSNAITPLDGNTNTIHFAKYEKDNSYGKAPIPAELDWLPFSIFADEYKANGNSYPYYSSTARAMDGHDDLKREVKSREWNSTRKRIFSEALDDINALNLNAANKKEFVEGVAKRIWESNKTNYIKLLRPQLMPVI